MAWIPGGTFLMGSDDWYPEESPAHAVDVDGFWIDRHPVTSRTSRRSSMRRATSRSRSGRSTPPCFRWRMRRTSSPARSCFRPRPARSISATSATGGRTCRALAGITRAAPGRPIVGLEQHPVTQVAWEDAAAYAAWAGKDLPTEAEWEFAARGGLDGAVYAWGDEFAPDGRMMANTWQGEFPWQNLELDGFAGTSPVGTFPANGYGLFDMTGNVWEWTVDYFQARHAGAVDHACCAPRNPRVSTPRRATIRRIPSTWSRAASRRAARISVRRTIAIAIVPPPARARRSTRRPGTSASAASGASISPLDSRMGTG